ncbi:MAG: cob(I)yrinic acid a,c-diamide adenosyltransferase [Actinomycetota bacterium]
MNGPADAPRTRRTPRDHPLLIVNTGHGKGKSTAAFGIVLRAWARGYRVGVYQFVKSGKWKVGEHKAAMALNAVEGGGTISWEKMGDGWTWTSRDLDQSADLAREGWQEVRRRIEAGDLDVLVLDEFTYPMTFGWVDTAEVVEVLRNRPGFQHVVVTGRDAPGELVAIADLVTEMRVVKHPHEQGIRGQQGIEW